MPLHRFFSDIQDEHMTSKKILAILFTLLFVIFAAGCGVNEGSAPAVNNSSAGNSSGDTSGTGGSGTTGNTGGSAALSWLSPSTYVDGTAMTVAGFKVYYGTSPRTYSHSIDVGDVITYSVNNLSSGTYYFSVTAYDLYGNESDYSAEASKTIM